jgi:hypothetical protein
MPHDMKMAILLEERGLDRVGTCEAVGVAYWRHMS